MRISSARLHQKLFVALAAMVMWALAAPAMAKPLPPMQVIELQGTSNTRDIGGYPADELRTVRMGQIIRSEKLSRLTGADFDKLEKMGVKTVIDLRTEDELEHSPTEWEGDNPPQFFHYEILNGDDDWFRAQDRLMRRNKFTEEQSLEHMKTGYRLMAETGLPGFRKVMDLVADESNWPILIHCNAGKDRSGIAVALVLEAVGVDREIIFDEYLLTNEISRTEAKSEYMARQSKKNSRSRIARAPSAAAWFPFIGVREEMLQAFYEGVEEHYGSMDAYLEELGLDAEARSALTASLTIENPEVAMGNQAVPGN